MNLTQYIKVLQKLEKKYGNSRVVCATDEEGNDYNPVLYAPSYHKELQGNGDLWRNVVCIN